MIGIGSVRIASAAFVVSLSFMATHEIDAGVHGEWRLLPFLSAMDDTIAANWFVALHVPLFIAIVWLAFLANVSTARWSQMVLSGLFVMHGVVHFALGSHPHYPFEGWLSSVLVYGALVSGLVSLFLHLRSDNREIRS